MRASVHQRGTAAFCSKCSESAKGQQQYAVRYEVQGQEILVGFNFY